MHIRTFIAALTILVFAKAESQNAFPFIDRSQQYWSDWIASNGGLNFSNRNGGYLTLSTNAQAMIGLNHAPASSSLSIGVPVGGGVDFYMPHAYTSGDNFKFTFGDTGASSFIQIYFSQTAVLHNYYGYYIENAGGVPASFGALGGLSIGLGGNMDPVTLSGATLNSGPTSLTVNQNGFLLGSSNWVSGTLHGAQISADAFTNQASSGGKIQITDAKGKLIDATVGAGLLLTGTTISTNGQTTGGGSGIPTLNGYGTNTYLTNFVTLLGTNVNALSNNGSYTWTTNVAIFANGIARVRTAGVYQSDPGSALPLGTGHNFVAGDDGNTMGSTDDYNAIGGGNANSITPTVGHDNVIAGGGVNVMRGGTPSSVSYSSIAGGLGGIIETNASAAVEYATIAGGRSNYVNAAYGFAAGWGAQAVHQGAFVWADSIGANFSSVGVDTFNIRTKSLFATNDDASGHSMSFSNGVLNVPAVTVSGLATFQNGFSSTGGSNTVGATIFTNALMKSTNLGTSAISYNLPLQNMIIAADTTFTIGAVDASRTLYAETVAIVSNSAAASKTLTPPVNYVLSGTNGVNPGGLNKVILWQDPGWISNMVSIQIR